MDKQAEKYILENYDNKTYQEMVNNLKEYSVTQDQIRYFLKKNNLKKTIGMFSKEDDQYILDNYLNMRYSDIAKHLGFSTQQITGRIHELGGKKYNKEYNGYFSKIDTALKAYFLGFIYADGYIEIKPYKYYYRFGMKLQAQDKYILDKLNEELGNVYDIKYEKPYKTVICGIPTQSHGIYNILIHNKQMVYDLYNLGIMPNKTYDKTIPYIPEEFFFDWLRGYIDGDGCFCLSEQTNKNQLHFTITGNNFVLFEYLQKRLLEYNIETHVYNRKNTTTYSLYTCKNQAIQNLITKLYYVNCFCLTRKFEKVKRYCFLQNFELIA